METVKFIQKYGVRGACLCGKCIDSPEKPEEKQPQGHTVDLTFFKVALKDGAKKEDFEEIVKRELPHYFDGKEHSYLQIGGDLGDQGLALMLIGIGHLLGVWSAMAPETIMPFLDKDLKMQMAGSGMISLKTGNI